MTVIVSASPVATHNHDIGTRRQSSTRAAARMAMSRAQSAKVSPHEINFRRSYRQPSESSDDEDPAPIKLSAEAQAILGEDNELPDSNKENLNPRRSGSWITRPEFGRTSGTRYESARRSPSSAQADGSPPARHFSISRNRPSPPPMLRDGSFAYQVRDKQRTSATSIQDSKTPAPRLRTIRVSGSRSQVKSPGSSDASAKTSAGSARSDHVSPDEEENDEDLKDRAYYQPPTTGGRLHKTEEHNGHSTTRTKRIGMMGNGTLKRGAVRRVRIPRPSEELDSGAELEEPGSRSPELQYGRRASIELDDNPNDLLAREGSPQPRKRFGTSPQPNRDSLQRSTPSNNPQSRYGSPVGYQLSSTQAADKEGPVAVAKGIQEIGKTSTSAQKHFHIPPPPQLESALDQENVPPPTFRREKPSAPVLEIHEDKENVLDMKAAQHQSANGSPVRAALAARNNNTPHRPAPPPPPPKMSLIEAATSNAGNNRSKKSVHYVLNGRTYRRLDCIGRGGSSRVFRIMAENYKIFALKRVNLEEADAAAIAGYKGEIELLKKLENVDRVIRLFDYEVNEDKGVLNVLMELGETDFNKMLNEQVKAEDAQLDMTFIKHYWKEMLQCVQAVHEQDIVHSDLKPANFLLVKGQLKLIDFGIANAIQDNTVNVHRENQIGTPNYMSPESLVCHAPVAGQAAGTKLLKLGKPSDVWSLGCILYQMTYGQPPFAHITKQFERIMSIPNPKVEIQFPQTGIGGAPVPFGLVETLRKCLQRDQTRRPTIKEMLSDTDSFLHPVTVSKPMLKRMITNVIVHCRNREQAAKEQGFLGREGYSCLPSDKDIEDWHSAFYNKMREAQMEGSAWS